MNKDGRQKTDNRSQKGKSPGRGNALCFPSSAVSILLFLASAGMLTVIQAPINLSPLAWVAFVPFIIACSSQAKTRQLIFTTYIISLFYWMGNLYWVAPITIIGWIAMCLYLAVLWPVLALSLRFCRKKKVPLFLASAILVVGVEQMQGLFLGGFYWRFLAHSQYQNITIIQIADIFGAGGVSFLVAMVNGLLAELIIAVREKKILRPAQFIKVVIVIVAVAASFFYGRWRISQESECIRPGPLAASLQSNVPQSVKRTFESSDVLFNDLMTQSNAAAAAGAELIVWPETMVQAILDRDTWAFLESPDEYIAFDKQLIDHAKDKVYLLVGAYGAEVELHNSEYYLAKYNSAFFYGPDGRQAPEKYDKIHLVPFSEALPFRRSIPRLYNFLMKFTPYNYDYSLDYGSKYTVFNMTGDPNREIPDYKFSVMICYEGTIPYIAREFALDENSKKQIDWIVNISNDGWFVRFEDDKVIPSAELPQHAAVCAFRAVENRLAVLRSVNTGISCLIDSSGRIRNGFSAGTLPSAAMDRMGVSGWFTDTIPIDTRTSFFSKYGEWFDFFYRWIVIMFLGIIAGWPQKGDRITLGRALLSFKGRMCRHDYWLKGQLVLLPVQIINNHLAFSVDNDYARLISIVISIALIWPGLALFVKRLHDRNRSGWFAATMFIPFVGIVFTIWFVIEVWFLRGTVGTNRFGEDTLQESSRIAQ